MEKIYFKNSKGRKIYGVISNTNSKVVVLICHGLGGNKDNFKYKLLQKKLAAAKISSLAIDFIGHGESDGEYNDLTLTEATDDILCAKHELEKRGYSEVGFVGYSFGGVGGIMSAAKEQFKFLVLISPPTYYNVREMIKSGIHVLWELRKTNKRNPQKKNARANIKFFKDYGSQDSYVAAKKINAPVLIIQGDKDKIVPVKRTIELHKKIKGAKLKLLKGANHHFINLKGILVDEIRVFIKKQLKIK